MTERLRNRLEDNLREMEALAAEIREHVARCDRETAELWEGLRDDEEVDDA